MKNDDNQCVNLLDILEVDEDIKNLLKRNNVKTIPQLLLDTLNNKGITIKQRLNIYSKCREITCFPRIRYFNNNILNKLNFNLGFKTGNKLLYEAQNNWNENNNLKTIIHVGSELLMNFLDGGLLLGEINEIFGQDLAIIRRVIHWIISNTMFYSYSKNFNLDNNINNISICNILYIQTTNNSFDPIFMKKCFEKLCGEFEQSQNSQLSSNISNNIELFLSNISIITINDYNELLDILYNLPYIKSNDLKNLKLVIIDPITSIIGFHIFAENGNYSNEYYKEIKDKIFIIGRLLKYNAKILNLSLIILSLVKNNVKQSLLNNQLLTNIKSPKNVHFDNFGIFSIPPPTRIFNTEIDQNWLFIPHNRILIENIGIANEEKAVHAMQNYDNIEPHIIRILRWTIFKSNRLAIGKYTCILQSKIGFIELDCQFT